MKAEGMQKEEIIIMLAELNDRLVELEYDLHSSIEGFKSDMYESRATRLEHCGKKLSNLEDSVILFEKDHKEPALKYSGNQVPKLELGY